MNYAGIALLVFIICGLSFTVGRCMGFSHGLHNGIAIGRKAREKAHAAVEDNSKGAFININHGDWYQINDKSYIAGYTESMLADAFRNSRDALTGNAGASGESK